MYESEKSKCPEIGQFTVYVISLQKGRLHKTWQALLPDTKRTHARKANVKLDLPDKISYRKQKRPSRQNESSTY